MTPAAFQGRALAPICTHRHFKIPIRPQAYPLRQELVSHRHQSHRVRASSSDETDVITTEIPEPEDVRGAIAVRPDSRSITCRSVPCRACTADAKVTCMCRLGWSNTIRAHMRQPWASLRRLWTCQGRASSNSGISLLLQPTKECHCSPALPTADGADLCLNVVIVTMPRLLCAGTSLQP